jgi:hypothetical protein
MIKIFRANWLFSRHGHFLIFQFVFLDLILTFDNSCPRNLNSYPGANPTIASYNASAVKIYNAVMSSLVHFESKKTFFEKTLLSTTTLAL